MHSVTFTRSEKETEIINEFAFLYRLFHLFTFASLLSKLSFQLCFLQILTDIRFLRTKSMEMGLARRTMIWKGKGKSEMRQKWLFDIGV